MRPRRSVLAVLVPAIVGLCAAVPAAAWAAPTFLTPQSLSLDGESAYQPQVAVGANGDAVAAWIRNSNSGFVVQAATRPAGGAWSPAQTISAVNAGNPRVAIDAGGNAIVVFDQSGVRYADAPAGQAFGPSQLLSNETQAEPQVAMDPAGDTFVAFVAGVSPNVSVMTATRPRGGGFGAAQTVSTPGRSPYRARIATDRGGDVIVAWTASDATTGYLEDTYRPAGGSWGAAQTLDTGGKNVSTPDVAIADDGSAVATWLQDLGTGYAVRAASDVPGVASAPVVTVGPSTELPTDPTVGVGPNGSATVVWTDHATTKQVVRESTRTATGQSFSTGVTISPPAEGADFPVAVMGPSGRTTVVWQSAVDASTIIVRATTRDVPTALFPASTRLTTTNELGYDPQVDADAAGDAVTVWRGDVPGVNSYVIRASGLDAAGPQLRALQVPATGPTNKPIQFSVTPVDVFSGAGTPQWTFGDGQSATGTAVEHTYTADGTYTVGLSVADGLGNTSSATGALTTTLDLTQPPGENIVAPKPPKNAPPLVTVKMPDTVDEEVPFPVAISATDDLTPASKLKVSVTREFNGNSNTTHHTGLPVTSILTGWTDGVDTTVSVEVDVTDQQGATSSVTKVAKLRVVPGYALRFVSDVVAIAPGATQIVPLHIARHVAPFPIDLHVGPTPLKVKLPASTTAKSVGVAVTMPASASAGKTYPLTITATSKTPAPSADPLFQKHAASATVAAAKSVDDRISGIEVTQGVEPASALTPPALKKPHTYRYRGVPLVAGRRTYVRVFAKRNDPTLSAPSPLVTLQRLTADGRLIAGAINPIFKPEDLSEVTKQGDLSYNPTGPYVFVLPPGWTATGRLSLTAHLVPFTAIGQKDPVCSTAACAADDVSNLMDIPFFPTAGMKITVVPVRYADVNGTVHMPNQHAIERGLRGAQMTEPVADSQFETTTADTIIDAPTTPDGDDDCGTDPYDPPDACRDDREEYVRGKLVLLGIENPALLTSPYLLAGTLHYTPGVSFPGTSLAEVDLGAPLHSVAHELGHLHGRKHADTACGGDQGTQVSEQGWPDGYGSIGTANGLRTDTVGSQSGGPYWIVGDPARDVRANRKYTYGADPRNPAPATGTKGPPNVFDVMSYCGGAENQTWTSVRGWLEDFAQLKGSVPADTANKEILRPISDDSMRAATLRNASAGGPGIFVEALETDAAAPHLLLTAPVDRLPVLRGAPSDVHAVALDASGAVLADVAMSATQIHNHRGDAQSLEAVLPPGASRIELRRGDVTYDARRSGPSAPTVRFGAPAAGARVGAGKTVDVAWVASDPDGDPVQATLAYSADAGRTWKAIYTGGANGHTTLPSRLFAASPKARLRVTVDDGFHAASADSPVFASVGGRPEAAILFPSTGQRFVAGGTLTLSGTGRTPAGRRLRGRHLTWFAGTRQIGHGEQVTIRRLRRGRRTFRLVARDSAGGRGSATVVVRVLRDPTRGRRLRRP